MRGPRTAMKSGPHLPQLEKALAQKRRPNTAKNQSINKILKRKKERKEQQRNHRVNKKKKKEYCKSNGLDANPCFANNVLVKLPELSATIFTSIQEDVDQMISKT